MSNFQEIAEELQYRVKSAINLKDNNHLSELVGILRENEWTEDAITGFLRNLTEAECKQGQQPERDGCTAKSGKTGTGTDKEEPKKDKSKEDEPEEETPEEEPEETTSRPPLSERPRTEMSKEERTKMKELESREDDLSDSEKKELRNLRDKRDNEKVDTALHMSKSEYNKLKKEYDDIEKRIEKKKATEEDLKRKEQLEEKGIGAGTPTSQAGEAVTHYTLRMLKEGYTEEEIEEYLDKLVSNPDHILGGSKALRDWVPRGMASARKVIDEVGGIDNIKTISWDTKEGRQAMNVSPDYKTSSDMFVETNEGKRIGVSLKKDGQVRILSGGWDKQQKELKEDLIKNDKNGELSKKKFRKKDGTLTTDENDPDIERENGEPVVTTSIDEFDRQTGAHTHKAEVDAAARAGATDILDNLEKEGMDGADGKELEKIIENEDDYDDEKKYGDAIIGSSSERKKTLEPYVMIDNPDYDPTKKETRNNPKKIKKMGHKKDENGNIVPVEGREAREQGSKQFLNRIKSGPKSKENPGGYTGTDLKVFAKIIQQSDIRNRHEKHHDDMRAADNALTKRTFDALNKDPALMTSTKNFILDRLHINKSLGFDLGEDLDSFVQVFGIGDDGVAMNAQTLVNLFGEKFESAYGQAMEEVKQIKKDYKDGKITKEEALNRIDEQTERVYEVIRDDLEVDYESGTVKFKQEFLNPDFDEGKPESEDNPRFKTSEYSLFDWFARAKGLSNAAAMELQNNEFMIFALENGTPDINQWPDTEKSRWFNKENNKIDKEEEERIKEGDKPPFEDLEKRREKNDKKWAKVDPKKAKTAKNKRK